MKEQKSDKKAGNNGLNWLGGFEVEGYQTENTIISIQNITISLKGKTFIPYQTK